MRGFFCLLFLATLPSTFAQHAIIDPNLAEYIVELHRYENPVNRDHFYWAETKTTLTNFSRRFNFDDYHYDGYVGGVLSIQGYDLYISKHPDAQNKFMPVYHGYHEDMKHNYFAKPHEPYIEGPIWYVSKVKDYQLAKYPLYTLDGQPIDFVGDLGYDTVYSRNLTEHLLPDKEDYVMYRVLGYVWDNDEVLEANEKFSARFRGVNRAQKIVKSEQTNSTIKLFVHGLHRKVTPVYQFFDEKDQNYYYKTVLDNPIIDRANYINVVGYVVKPQDAANFSQACNTTGNALVPLISAYAKTDAFSMTVLFLSEQTYAQAEKDLKTTFTDKKILGYVTVKDNACQSRYKLNIYKSWNGTVPSPGNPNDHQVFISPDGTHTSYDLFYDQTFKIW
ncbi:hypothetical protein M3Y96_00579300 [Aphelenchoides besseyi]|nr:hypothetical protein M3Y96_00579300 [Aphelenchoides besseyi]